MPAFHAGDAGASPARAIQPEPGDRNPEPETGPPPNALGDEHRSFKPGKEARFLPGALLTGTRNPTTGTRNPTREYTSIIGL